MQTLRANKWVCFALACMISALDFGLAFSFGAIFVELMDTFGTDRKTAATVHSLLLGVSLSFGVCSGILINVLGLPMVVLISSILLPIGFCVSFFITDIHYLYISIGIASGVGISMGYTSAVTSISRVFTGKQKSLCVAIHGTCIASAGIAYPYILKWLVNTYSMRGTFLILGGAYLNNFVYFVFIWMNRSALSIRVQNVPEVETIGCEIVPMRKGTRNKFYRKIIHAKNFSKKLMSKPFICLAIATALALSTVNVYLEFAFDIANWKGFDESKAKELFFIFSCCNVVSAIAPGLLRQKKGVNIYICPIASTVFGSIGHLLVYLSSSYAINVIAVCLIGLIIGGIVSTTVVIIMESMSLNQVGVATGLIYTMNGILSAGGGPLFGSLRDNSGSYASVLITIASGQAAASCLFIDSPNQIAVRSLLYDQSPMSIKITLTPRHPPKIRLLQIDLLTYFSRLCFLYRKHK